MARKSSAASDLIEKLNAMVAALISENRKLRRDAVKLTDRAAAAATKTAKRGARRVKKAVPRAKMRAKAKATPKRKPAPAGKPKKKTSPRGTRRSGR